MKKEIKKSIKTTAKKETDTEMLARLMVDGFDRMRIDIHETEIKITKKVDDRCDRIENILMRAQDNRIERLEDKMRRIETELALK
jgi:hypothetical protein